jgi:hypothetical protein
VQWRNTPSATLHGCVLGGATRSMLEAITVPVLMSH